MRYQFTPIEKRWDGKTVYKTTYYPLIPESYDDIYVTVSEADFLDSLAKKYYGDESFWWIIARANNLTGYQLSFNGTRQIRIPSNISNILNNLKNLN